MTAAPDSKIITTELVAHVEAQFRLDWHGIHGAAHWSRVRTNGLRVGAETGADARVVELFAFLHDSQRENDGFDPEHGARAADFAVALNGQHFDLAAADLDLLVVACRGHSQGGIEAHPTVQTCWDADRLDLGRVGKRPDPARLCTAAARDASLIRWAFDRSIEKPARARPR